MSDNNRIIRPGGGDQPQAQIRIDLAWQPGVVLLIFDPAAKQVVFTPAGARSLAIGILQRAEAADAPPDPLAAPMPGPDAQPPPPPPPQPPIVE